MICLGMLMLTAGERRKVAVGGPGWWLDSKINCSKSDVAANNTRSDR
jgi:hypothetical protein